MCVRGIDFPLTTIFQLDFRTVPTMWYFLFFILFYSVTTINSINEASQAKTVNNVGWKYSKIWLSKVSRILGQIEVNSCSVRSGKTKSLNTPMG